MSLFNFLGFGKKEEETEKNLENYRKAIHCLKEVSGKINPKEVDEALKLIGNAMSHLLRTKRNDLVVKLGDAHQMIKPVSFRKSVKVELGKEAMRGKEKVNYVLERLIEICESKNKKN